MKGAIAGQGAVIISLLLIAAGLSAVESVNDALGRVPWYDATTDDWKRVVPRERSAGSSGGMFGDVSLFAFAMYALIIAALALLLALIWKLRTPPLPTAAERQRARVQAGAADLPLDLAELDGDPEAGFQAACAAGDWRRAIIWLYAWQLLALDAAGRLRLVAGKTNRAYLAEVAHDATIAETLRATVVVFERIYFGRETIDEPTVRALEIRHRSLLATSVGVPVLR